MNFAIYRKLSGVNKEFKLVDVVQASSLNEATKVYTQKHKIGSLSYSSHTWKKPARTFYWGNGYEYCIRKASEAEMKA